MRCSSGDAAFCAVCESASLRRVDGFEVLPRVTSDCRVFPSGGELFVCYDCGTIQKRPTSAWLSEIEKIYSVYSSYYQSGGDEQIVFDRVTGTPRRRSEVILDRLFAEKQIGVLGHALDVGCGNGVTLSAMSRMLTDWSFSGYELGDGSLPRLLRIPRFKRLYTGAMGDIKERFDLVTMVHALEHFPSPREALVKLLPIVGDGKLFIEVANVDENPFDILIADHLMHFTPVTLSALLRRVGFLSMSVATDWVPKEISLLAKVGQTGEEPCDLARMEKSSARDVVMNRLTGYVDWLRCTVDCVGRWAQERGSFGIFGTSIAGTWLAGAMEDAIEFFVDEDPSRVGKDHMGKPILHPSQVPDGAKVYFALAPSIAGKVAARVQSKQFETLLPPPLEAL